VPFPPHNAEVAHLRIVHTQIFGFKNSTTMSDYDEDDPDDYLAMKDGEIVFSVHDSQGRAFWRNSPFESDKKLRMCISIAPEFQAPPS
jgi:hypothetical protein